MICNLDPSASEDPVPKPDANLPVTQALHGLLLESLLEEQQTLRTPVALFSEAYDSKAPSQRFSHLIPLSRPDRDEQYAFEVNLDACTGCKACVAACHSLNGLDDNEAWRDMGLLVGTRKQPYLQTVTTACHHCLEPACAEGCPVLAYDKDSLTGIVRHLDDQCIGCSYCILKCPYDVPKFNFKRGIVRKCDMCHGRLSEGEAPACVQACPNEAIKIVNRKVSEVEREGQIIAGAFDSSYTGPTTRYTSKRPLPEQAHAADEGRLVKDHAHMPLSWMLVMTQMSAGAFLTATLGLGLQALTIDDAGWISGVAFAIGFVGIHLSVLHLGQPLKAWRAFMGWRKSWLSREILAFGAYAGAGSMALAAWLLPLPILVKPALILTTFVGIVAVATSIMVYVDTRRPYWSAKLVSLKFIGTLLILGTALTSTVSAFRGSPNASLFFLSALVLQWLMFGIENREQETALKDEKSARHRSARSMEFLHAPQLAARRFLFVLTGLLLPLLVAGGFSQPSLYTLWTALAFTSQLIERIYFFTACSGPKMPGN